MSSSESVLTLCGNRECCLQSRCVRGAEHSVGIKATCIRDCSLTTPRLLLSSSDEIERRWKVLHHERNTCALTEIRDLGAPSPRVFHPLSRLVEILEGLLFVPEHQQSFGKIHQAPDPRRPVRGPRSPFDALFADADCPGVVTHRHVIQAKIRSDVRSEEHTSELQSRLHLVCRLLLEKKKK